MNPYLLQQGSAIERLLTAMQAKAQPTPPFNPNAPAPQGILNVPRGEPVAQQGLIPMPQAQAPVDDAHEHREGLLGGLRHLIGADRMQPELAALLTPDQERRAKPGLLRSVAGAVFEGKGPQAIQMERATQMLGLTDEKKTRDTRAAVEAQRGQLIQAMGPMPETPAEQEAWIERGARMVATAPVPDAEFAEQLRLTAGQLRERMIQPRANAKLTVLGDDGNYYAVQQDAMGNEVPNSRIRVPQPRSGITYREGVGPDGQPVIYALPSQESGDRPATITPRETGVQVPVDLPAPRQMSAREREQDAIRRELLSLTERSLQEVRKTQGLDAQGRPIAGARSVNISGREVGVIPTPEWLKNNLLRGRYGGDAGARARAMFGNLLSQVAKARSGGAVTDAEFNRLEAFLPTSNDDEATVMQKLADFVTELKEIQRIYSETPSGTPSRVPTFEEWQAARRGTP